MGRCIQGKWGLRGSFCGVLQAQGVSVTITGDLFLQLISVNTSVLVRDVLVLDAYFFFFVACGIALLYLTLPRPLVVRRPRWGAPKNLLLLSGSLHSFLIGTSASSNLCQ
jgi:hypothetical protein